MTSQYTTKLMLEISNVRDLTFVLLGPKSFLFVSFLLNVMGKISKFLFLFFLLFIYIYIYIYFFFFFKKKKKKFFFFFFFFLEGERFEGIGRNKIPFKTSYF